MKEEQEFHMSYEDFQENGRILLDWIVNYYRNIEKYPVLSGVQPGEIREQLPEQAPRTGESFEHILKDVDDIILRGITHWQSPNFFAFFPANTSGPSILGELLSAGLGVQGMMWATSPACTELETRVLDWLVDMLGLPQKFKSTHKGGGVIKDTASSASLCAVIAAREQTTGFQCNKRGGEANLVAYVSTQTHSSLEKAVKIAGIGKNNLRLVDVDGRYAMKPGYQLC